MINSGRQAATAEYYPLGGELPDVQFDLSSGLNGEALFVEEKLRTLAGVTLTLAAQQVDAQHLRNMALGRQLSLKVLVVPKEFTGEGMPMQFGAAVAELGFHLVSNDLTICGRSLNEPMSGAQLSRVGSTHGNNGVWRPSRAYAGTPESGFADYSTLPIRPFELDEAQRSVGYERLVMAARNLGDVAAAAVSKLAQDDRYGVQVELNNRTTVTPRVPSPYRDDIRARAAAFRQSLLDRSSSTR